MSQVSRKWVEDNAIDHTKLDPTDSSYIVAGLHNTGSMVVDGTASIGLGAYIGGDATVGGGFRVDGTAVIHALSAEMVVYDQLMIEQSDPQPAFIVNKTDAGTDYVVGVNNSGTGPTLVLNSTGSNVPGLQIVNAGTGTGATDGAVLRLDAANNLEIWNYEATQIQLATGGTQRVVIDATGSVGIGTTQPMTTLDVEGSLRLYTGTWVNEISTSTALGTSDNVLSTQNAVKSYVDGAAGSSSPWLRDSTLGNTYLRTNSDNVGIGTTIANSYGWGTANKIVTVQSTTADNAGIVELVSPSLTGANEAGMLSIVNLNGVGANSYVAFKGYRDGADDSLAAAFVTTAGGSSYIRMTIKASGLVGIGTTTPSAGLDVVMVTTDAARFRSGDANTGVTAGHSPRVLIQNTDPTLNNTEDVAFADSTGINAQIVCINQNHSTHQSALSFQTHTGSGSNTTEVMRLSSTGYVGIGTTNPACELHVQHDVDDPGDLFRLTNASALTSAATRMAFATSASVGAATFIQYGGGHSTKSNLLEIGTQVSGGLQFITSGNDRVRIDASGNVGIGTTSPMAPLHVVGGIDLSGLSNRAINHRDAYALTFGTNNTERMRIDASGNVGIGTTSPTGSSLHVYASAGVVKVESSHVSVNSTYIQFNNAAGIMYVGRERLSGGDFLGGDAYAGIIGVTDAHPMQFATSNVVRMTIDSAGLVGIGTTGPANVLDVRYADGVIRLESTTGTHAVYTNYVNSGSGAFYVGRDNSAGSAFNSGTAYAGVIQVAGTSPLQFMTGNPSGLVRMTIDSAGQVTIASLAGLLSTGYVKVNPSGVLSNAASVSWGEITGYSHGVSTNYVPYAASSSAWGNSSIQVSGTNVGISTSPSFKLHVYESSGAPYSIVDSAGVRTGMMSNSFSTTGWMGTYSAHTCYIGASGSTSQLILETTGVIRMMAGAVGIGTTPTATRLHVYDNTVTATQTVYVQSNCTSTTFGAVTVYSNAGSAALSGWNSTDIGGNQGCIEANLLSSATGGCFFTGRRGVSTPIFKVSYTGQIYSDAGTTISSPADFAEFSRVVGPLEDYFVGTVVAQSETEDMKVTMAQDIEHVYGIVTDRARFCGGLEGEKEDFMNLSVEELEKKHNARRIALCGHVLCKVVGKIKRGERLTVSDIPGVARSAKTLEEKMMFFAMARQSYDSETVGLIEVKL